MIVNPARLSVERRQLLIENDAGRHTVPLEDLGVLVLDHDAIQLTGPLLGELGDYGVAAVVCNAKHLPSAIILPLRANELMTQTLRGQIAAKQPAKKRAWQAIVRAKIHAQGRLLLEKFGDDVGLGALAAAVASGDTTNCEAQAASRYFPRLFGPDFERMRQAEPEDAVNEDRIVNAMLNYGYAVLRAAVARAVVAAGLHPALGVHHRHRNNAFCLADDLMEPLRPLVDRETFDRVKEGGLPSDLTPELKRRVLSVLTAQVRRRDRLEPLDVALEAYAAEVRGCLLGEIQAPEVPSA